MTTTQVRSATDWSGKPFAAPRPALLTRSWRVKKGLRSAAALAPLAFGTVSTLAGQDSITASTCSRGLPVYCGYYNGTFANLNSFRALFPAAIILSITPNGVKGARCIDCEPGDATVAGAAQFVADNLPEAGAGGRGDGGKPMVYCSAGDSQAVINAVAAKGIARSQWILWSAHWIGQHICSRSGCGYPDADGTQYDSNNSFDSDLFYSYCFGAVSPWPLQAGSAGPLVVTLQTNINKWVAALASTFNIPPLAVDGAFGPLTQAAVALAQLYFGDHGPSGTCDQALYNALARNPVNPPPPPPYAYQPVAGLKVLGAGPYSVRFEFTANPQPHNPARFEVAIFKGDKISAKAIPTYPRYIDFVATGVYSQQLGGVEPSTGYVLAVRPLSAAGTTGADYHNGEWETAHFQTAP